MKDKLSFPTFTHDSIAGYCNDKPLYAQYKNDKKSKYIGTKQIWQELSKLQCDLEIAKSYIKGISQMVINSGDNIYVMIGHFKKLAEQTLEQIEHKE